MSSESESSSESVQTWLVGSGDDCDIVVAHARVSPHHFQISRTGNRLSIQDVNSEHGTWLDGVPVVGPKPIRRGQRIMLAETVEFLWPAEFQEIHSVIKIGRSEQNDVVLDKPNISTFHAELIDDGESLWIKDCGSTNGVCLNRPDNHIDKHRVVPTDAIYLGSTRITIDRILSVGLQEGLSGKALADRVAKRLESNHQPPKFGFKNHGALMTSLAFASLVLGAVLAFSISKALSDPEPTGSRGRDIRSLE